ncbi:hypothetical protein CAC99_13830 [Salmonella enterica]|nr:hypothetical protein [Salmonella enterica]
MSSYVACRNQRRHLLQWRSCCFLRILPARVQEIALQTGLAECETSAKSNKAVKEKKSTTSQEG